jgi:hypothetical protein
VNVGATRGGIRYTPNLTLAAGAGGSRVWSEELDAAPSDEVKPCLVVACDEEAEEKVSAITACAQIGNFSARFNPEFWTASLEALAIAHSRLAEQTLYAAITDTATTGVLAATYPEINSITEILNSIDKAVAGLRSRLKYTGAIRLITAAWVRQALRAAITSNKFSTDPQQALAVSDSIIDTFFAVRGVIPTWSWDLDVFGAQTGGAVVTTWPGSSTTYALFPEGAWMFLDGGTLDLGMEITDSTLNATNDRQAFYETFELAAFRGPSTLVVTVDLAEACLPCPDFGS